MMMQQLIEGFAKKRASERAEDMKAVKPQPLPADPVPSRIALPSALDACEGADRDEVERYVREWRSVSMRWRIYDNEASDCVKEMEALRKRRDAARLVREHLATEMSDAQRRLREAQAEVELIQVPIIVRCAVGAMR
jgi:hypothetical protein